MKYGIKPKDLVLTAIIAAIYTVITLVFAPVSYGLIQFRISEALTVLPFLTSLAVPGLFVGCILSNIFGGYGIYDIVFGSLATLIAAFLTRIMPNDYLAPLPPVIVNGLIIGTMLHYILNVPLLISILYVAFGELVVCYILGLPLLVFFKKRNIF
jgi:uncharacterized membrane protein